MTIAESLACGTPAVGIDYSAVPEVIGPGGVVTPIASIIDNEYGSFWAACNQKIFGDVTARLLDNDAERKALGRAGVAHVRSSFSWKTAARQFTEVMVGPGHSLDLSPIASGPRSIAAALPSAGNGPAAAVGSGTDRSPSLAGVR